MSSISSLGYDNLSTAELQAINQLNAQNRLAEALQTETKVKSGSSSLSTQVQRTNYKNWFTDVTLPKDVQTLKGIYNSSSNKLQDRLVYHAYYSNGSIKEASKKDGGVITYIWGYNNQLPVAKVENATYAQIQSLPYFGSNFTIVNGLSANQEASLRANLGNALVTTYSYEPLVGVTRITDPSGVAIHYEYDAFNRLWRVKNNDGHIVSENAYNYKN